MKVRLGVLAVVVFVMALGAQAAEPSVSFLPLGKSMVGEGKLPLPIGIGATFYYQEQDYSLNRVNSFTLPPIPALAGLTPQAVNGLVQTADVENELVEVNLKCDAWLLPFLNVFGIFGYIDGETDVSIGVPMLGTLDIPIDYDGIVYGPGVTLVGGIDNVFASLTATYTWTDLDTSGSSIESLVVMPRLGYSLPDFGATKGVQLWIGGMYLETEEQHEGTKTVAALGPFPIDYDVELEQDEDWSYLIGAHIALTDRIGIEVEGGFGDRTSGTASVGMRF